MPQRGEGEHRGGRSFVPSPHRGEGESEGVMAVVSSENCRLSREGTEFGSSCHFTKEPPPFPESLIGGPRDSGPLGGRNRLKSPKTRGTGAIAPDLREEPGQVVLGRGQEAPGQEDLAGEAIPQHPEDLVADV